jgi:hypothetical protein
MALIMLEKCDRDEALLHNETVLGNLKETPNYTGLVESNRFYVGALGEIAFRKWAISRGLVFVETSRDDGESDEQDFILYARRSGKPCTVNVKCSLHPRAQYLMQPVAQHSIYSQDLYVGCTGEDDGERVAVILAGAMTRKVFDERAQERMFKVPSLVVPLADLTYSMERIASSFKTKEK